MHGTSFLNLSTSKAAYVTCVEIANSAELSQWHMGRVVGDKTACVCVCVCHFEGKHVVYSISSCNIE